MAVRLEYKLIGTGWSECTLEIDGRVATVTASYLGDALGDLASAVTAAMRGSSRAVASFWEEPGEYRWVLEAPGPGRVRVRILEFQTLPEGLPDEHGSIVLDAECSSVALTGAMVGCLESVEQTYGTAGYRQKWVEHDFPSERVAELKELLRSREGAVEQADAADDAG